MEDVEGDWNGAGKMKFTRGRVFRILVLTLCLVGVLMSVTSCNNAEGPQLIDRSTINMVALSDGTHPWLTISLLRDPTEKDLCPMRWSPVTRTLAYLDDKRLCTWNPSNQLQLDGGKNWRGLQWSPNGQYLVTSCTEETIVVDAQTMTVKRTYDGQWIVWWSGQSICAAKRMDAYKRSRKEVAKLTSTTSPCPFLPG